MLLYCNSIDKYLVMIRLLLLWILVFRQTHTIVLQDSYNILLKDSVHYKINQTISHYETITNEQIITFQIKMEDKDKFDSLERLLKQEYDKELKHSTAPTIEVFQLRNKKLEAKKATNVIYISSKPSFSTEIKKVTDDNDNNYDYNYLNKEYYIETLNAMFSNKTYNISKDRPNSGQTIVTDVSFKKEQNHINEVFRTDGVKKIKCVEDKRQTKIQLTRDNVLRVCYIIKIWILVYTAIAVPMWFTRGWCCCCLNCKVFKPRRTIEEAKKYLILYPPGVFNTKKRIIEYEPSEREKEKYEEFEHFIRTL